MPLGEQLCLGQAREDDAEEQVVADLDDAGRIALADVGAFGPNTGRNGGPCRRRRGPTSSCRAAGARHHVIAVTATTSMSVPRAAASARNSADACGEMVENRPGFRRARRIGEQPAIAVSTDSTSAAVDTT